MSQSREKLVTDGQTDERTKVNLWDLQAGPKKGKILKSFLIGKVGILICSLTDHLERKKKYIAKLE